MKINPVWYNFIIYIFECEGYIFERFINNYIVAILQQKDAFKM